MRTAAEERAVRFVLADADLVWEAIGPDGIHYGFDTDFSKMNEEQRVFVGKRTAAVDNAIAVVVVGVVVAVEVGET